MARNVPIADIPVSRTSCANCISKAILIASAVLINLVDIAFFNVPLRFSAFIHVIHHDVGDDVLVAKAPVQEPAPLCLLDRIANDAFTVEEVGCDLSLFHVGSRFIVEV